MSHAFNADEILEMAEQIERNGALFYRESADSLEDKDARKFLLQLARMEDNHLKTFANMRAQLSGKEKESPSFDPNNEVNLYLGTLADTKVFFQKDVDTSTLRGIYKAAILAEKDSIAFYIGIKELVPDYLGKDKLDDIIKEEMKHIKILNEKLIDLGE